MNQLFESLNMFVNYDKAKHVLKVAVTILDSMCQCENSKWLTQDENNVSQVAQEVDMYLSRGDHNCKQTYVSDT